MSCLPLDIINDCFRYIGHLSVQFSRSVVSDSWQPHGLQHARLPCKLLELAQKLMSIELVMPSNHLILCHPLLLKRLCKEFLFVLLAFLEYLLLFTSCLSMMVGFPGGSDGKESACNAGDPGSIPGSGRSPGGGNGNPLQYSCLGNPMDRGAWHATVQGVAKNLTQLSRQACNKELTIKFNFRLCFLGNPD